MRPDEWQRAMEHEAASVEDGGWAREARRGARLLGWSRALGCSAAVYVALGFGHVAALLIWPQAWPHLWTVTLMVAGGLALWLGRFGLPSLMVGVGALAFLPAAWTAVVLLQALWPGHAPSTPGFSDDGIHLAMLTIITLGCAGIPRSLSGIQRPSRGTA